jgi:hypothetical protein
VKRLVLAALLAAAACGGNNNGPGQDAPPPPPPGSDANPGSDAPPPPAATLTSYVIDLVTNHTTATELPRPFTEFASLPDPDGANNNLTAYQSLF